MLFGHHRKGGGRKTMTLSRIPIMVHRGKFSVKDLPFLRNIEFFTPCYHYHICDATPDETISEDDAGAPTGTEQLYSRTDRSWLDPQIFRHKGGQVCLEDRTFRVSGGNDEAINSFICDSLIILKASLPSLLEHV